MDARWGMSRAAVEQANGVSLRPFSDISRFYTPPPRIKDLSRFQWFQQDGVPFLNRRARVGYLFFDGRFFAYHVFVSDKDPDRLDEEMRAYLEREFGPEHSRSEEEAPLKEIWQSKRLIVNYWLFQEELSLAPKFTAGFGVVFRPLEDEIIEG